MIFQKEDLQCSYTWANEIKQEIFTGMPTRRKFDRFNGFQVLFIINLYGSTLEGFSIQQGQNLEHIIMNNLPLEATSEISVFNWLNNFQKNQVN